MKIDSADLLTTARTNMGIIKLQLEGELAQRFARVRSVGEGAKLRPLTDEEMLVELMECYLRYQSTDWPTK